MAGYSARSSATGEGARAHSGHGRRDRGQHLHQDLSVLPRPVRLRRGAGDSAGDRAVSQLVLVQHLRDFVVVARHPGAAVDRLCQEAVQEDSRRAGHRRAVSSAAAPRANCGCSWAQEADQLAEFLPGARPAGALFRAGARSPAALAGAEGGGEVDAGAPGDERRPGRDLSRHHELDHRAALPGIFAGRSAGDPRHGRVREAGHRGRDDLPHAALHVAGVGHGLRGVCAGARAEWRPTIRAWCSPASGC